MTKTEFYEKVAKDTNAAYTHTVPWVNAVLDSLIDAIITEDEVKIAGLGAFEHVGRKARQGRNAATGEAIEIPARTAVKFKPSGKIKQAVAVVDPPAPKK